MKDKMNKRTTFIVGAGAPLDLSLSSGIAKPTTAYITDEVCKAYNVYFPIDGNVLNGSTPGTSNIVQEIADKLRSCYPDPNPYQWIMKQPVQGSWVNFEHLFHVLEMLNSYKIVWDGQCRNASLYPVFAPFTQLNFTMRPDTPLSWVMSDFIRRVMDIVGAYDCDFKEHINNHSWYTDFFRTFGVNADIFNLCYDTTIENSLENYEDGYELIDTNTPFRRFNPKRLYTNPNNLPTVNHLHGCINYWFQSFDDINTDVYTNDSVDLYKYNDYIEVRRRMIGSGRGNSTTQTGETYYPSPILTGLRKTDKLNSSPFDFYHTKLNQSLIANPNLVIIGYSFGDLYINQIINRMRAFHGADTRVVVIGYWPDMRKFGNYHAGQLLNQSEGAFMCKISEMSDFDATMKSILDNEVSKGIPISDNGSLLVYTDGFMNAASKSADIVSFLK